MRRGPVAIVCLICNREVAGPSPDRTIFHTSLFPGAMNFIHLTFRLCFVPETESDALTTTEVLAKRSKVTEIRRPLRLTSTL